VAFDFILLPIYVHRAVSVIGVVGVGTLMIKNLIEFNFNLIIMWLLSLYCVCP
jgi:hypothetical protein